MGRKKIVIRDKSKRRGEEICQNWAKLKGVKLSNHDCNEGRKDNRYAILWSCDTEYRHLNDLEFLYRTLVDVYDFKDDHIYVLTFHGGAEYKKIKVTNPKELEENNGYPGAPICHPPEASYRLNWFKQEYQDENFFDSTFENLQDVVERLKDAHGFLFIHTNGHAEEGKPDLCTSGLISPSEFGKEIISKLDNFDQLLVMMQQCHSGKFADHVLDNRPDDNDKKTYFVSSCGDKPSNKGYIEGRSFNFDDFVCHWTAVMNHCYPYGSNLYPGSYDLETNGGISGQEAFIYAKDCCKREDKIDGKERTPMHDWKPKDKPIPDEMFLGKAQGGKLHPCPFKRLFARFCRKVK